MMRCPATFAVAAPTNGFASPFTGRLKWQRNTNDPPAPNPHRDGTGRLRFDLSADCYNLDDRLGSKGDGESRLQRGWTLRVSGCRVGVDQSPMFELSRRGPIAAARRRRAAAQHERQALR